MPDFIVCILTPFEPPSFPSNSTLGKQLEFSWLPAGAGRSHLKFSGTTWSLKAQPASRPMTPRTLSTWRSQKQGQNQSSVIVEEFPLLPFSFCLVASETARWVASSSAGAIEKILPGVLGLAESAQTVWIWPRNTASRCAVCVFPSVCEGYRLPYVGFSELLWVHPKTSILPQKQCYLFVQKIKTSIISVFLWME